MKEGIPAQAKKKGNLGLAQDRTRWAAERTLMAWLRTALSMIGFGFAIDSIFARKGLTTEVALDHASYIGGGLVLLGSLSLIIAIIQHLGTIKRLNRDCEHAVPRYTLAVWTAIMLTLIGISALFFILMDLSRLSPTLT